MIGKILSFKGPSFIHIVCNTTYGLRFHKTIE